MRLHSRVQCDKICILDVSSIFAQMHGNAVRTGLLGNQRRFYRLRIRSAARLAQRRDMVNIDAKMQFIRVTHCPVLLFVAGHYHVSIPSVLCGSSTLSHQGETR